MASSSGSTVATIMKEEGFFFMENHPMIGITDCFFFSICSVLTRLIGTFNITTLHSHLSYTHDWIQGI
ncbi:hypothetical protein ACJX0J_024511, partial [Zea mays]